MHHRRDYREPYGLLAVPDVRQVEAVLLDTFRPDHDAELYDDKPKHDDFFADPATDSGDDWFEIDPETGAVLSDGEIDIAMSFDPASTAAEIMAGLLPDSARVFVPEGGTLGNISFVAIPYNAASREGAMVVANFLLDPETQARQQNIEVLGSYSVLDPARLNAAEAALFDALPSAPALPTLADLGPTLLEPHASWMTRLAEEWARRYR